LTALVACSARAAILAPVTASLPAVGFDSTTPGLSALTRRKSLLTTAFEPVAQENAGQSANAVQPLPWEL
jgi:hypothetical protein